jgi:hypothetical protein
MEKIINETPRKLPNKINYNSPKTSSPILISRNSDSDLTREQFDPSSFSSSPPNEFVKFLKQRIEKY